MLKILEEPPQDAVIILTAPSIKSLPSTIISRCQLINLDYIQKQDIENFILDTAKDKSIIVCCYHGNSSQRAAQFLVNNGFNDVYSLNGGYELWKSLDNQ